MESAWVPSRFIDAQIEVEFDRPPTLSKRPGPPDRFRWDCEEFHIVDLLGTWVDYGRRGDMSRNMQPAHLRVAAKRGSWGVGRFYFRVLTQVGRAFDLYYDRAPKDAGDRVGTWILWRELARKNGAD